MKKISLLVVVACAMISFMSCGSNAQKNVQDSEAADSLAVVGTESIATDSCAMDSCVIDSCTQDSVAF